MPKELSMDQYRDGVKLLKMYFSESEKQNTTFDYDYLKDIPDQLFAEGIKKIIENYQYKYYPSIATIRFYCGYDLDSVTKYAIDTKLRKGCKAVRDARSLSFTDKALNYVCEQFGGHSVIKKLTDEEWTYKQKAMKEMYSHSIRCDRGIDRVKGTNEKQFNNIAFAFQVSIVDSVEQGAITKVIQIGKDKKLINPGKDQKYLPLIGMVEKESNQYKQIENLLTKEM